MGTPALYTFISKEPAGLEAVHFVHHSDGYPRGAADIIPDLARAASQIWEGKDVDLNVLHLPDADAVERWDSPEQSAGIRPVPFRYEIEVIKGRPVAIKAERHAPDIPEAIERRLESARVALEEAEAAMFEAMRAPTYIELGNGSLQDIRSLGQGEEEQDQ